MRARKIVFNDRDINRCRDCNAIVTQIKHVSENDASIRVIHVNPLSALGEKCVFIKGIPIRADYSKPISFIYVITVKLVVARVEVCVYTINGKVEGVSFDNVVSGLS
jgi:hypothetical protein